MFLTCVMRQSVRIINHFKEQNIYTGNFSFNLFNKEIIINKVVKVLNFVLQKGESYKLKLPLIKKKLNF